ncbi:MAG: DUF4153 domain-containing protein [Pseudomonadota bacterium]
MVAMRLSRSTLHKAAGGLAQSLARFPLPMAAALLAAVQGILLSHGWNTFGSEAESVRLFVFFALTFFVLLAAHLLVESRAWPRLALVAVAAVGVALLGVRVFTYPADSWSFYKGPLLFLAPCVVLLVTIAPLLRRNLGNVAFWNFNRAGWLGAALGLLAALILGTGISSALYALETLFELNLRSELYVDLWVLCMTVIWPWLTLANLPRSFDTEACEVPWGLKTVTLYILMPLVLIYLLILYGYIGRVAYLWLLPKGQVATLITIYATIGVITYLLDYPFRRKGNLASRLYSRMFFPALFLPLGVLIIALWHRISDYGVTEARYAVGLFGLWLLLCTIYVSLRKRPQLIVLPALLAAFLALASFGPWGAVGLSTHSQIAQLSQVLSANGMLIDGRIRRAEQPLPFAETKRISSIVNYLMDSGRSNVIAPWFANSAIEFTPVTTSEQVLSALNLDYVREWQDKANFSFNVARDQVLNVDGFEVMAQVRLAAGHIHTLVALDGTHFYAVELAENGRTVTVSTPSGQELKLLLVKPVEALREGDHTDYQKTRLMTLQASKGNLRVRLYLAAINGVIEEDGPLVTSAEGILLVGTRPLGGRASQ